MVGIAIMKVGAARDFTRTQAPAFEQKTPAANASAVEWKDVARNTELRFIDKVTMVDTVAGIAAGTQDPTKATNNKSDQAAPNPVLNYFWPQTEKKNTVMKFLSWKFQLSLVNLRKLKP